MSDLAHPTPLPHALAAAALQLRLRDAMAPLVAWVQKVNRALSRFMEAQANDPITVAGLEARYYVRAGMAHVDPDADPQLVQSILRGEAPDTYWLTPANRILVAVAAMQGEARRGPDPDRPRHTHHRWGRDAAQVVLR